MKTFIQHLIEKRSHAEFNPKTSINQIIKDAVTSTKSKIAGEQNLFISMTSIEKLGINPRSKYNTPIGIYSYPAQYVYDTVGDTKKLNELPYVGDSPFVNIFSVRGNIVNLNNMPYAELNKHIAKFEEILTKKLRRPIRLDMVVQDSHSDAKVSTVGGRFWYISMVCAELLNHNNIPIGWNSLFLQAGIDGCIDTEGEGIIHFNEPTQAVFFSKRAIAKNARYDNKYTPEDPITIIIKRIEKGDPRLTEKDYLEAASGDSPFNFYRTVKNSKNGFKRIPDAVIQKFTYYSEFAMAIKDDPNILLPKQYTPMVLSILMRKYPYLLASLHDNRQTSGLITDAHIDTVVKIIRRTGGVNVGNDELMWVLTTIRDINVDKFNDLIARNNTAKVKIPERILKILGMTTYTEEMILNLFKQGGTAAYKISENVTFLLPNQYTDAVKEFLIGTIPKTLYNLYKNPKYKKVLTKKDAVLAVKKLGYGSVPIIEDQVLVLKAIKDIDKDLYDKIILKPTNYGISQITIEKLA